MSMGAASFAPVVVERVARAGGGFVLRGPPLSTPARCVGDWLVQHAHTAPTRIFLAERADGGWRTVSYGVALALVRSLAQALIDLGLSADKPLAIVSGNGLDHALLALAAMHVGIPVAPLSPAYSLQSKDHAKLKALIDVVGPGAVYASDATVFARALAALPPSLVRLDGAAEELARGVRPSLAVDDAFARVGPDTIAKILFTSGSTGA
ncbi:MAG TPA: AMP-binding protein, partial [Myxococcota bacterium]